MQNLWLKAENIIKSRVTHVAAHRSVILFEKSQYFSLCPPAFSQCNDDDDNDNDDHSDNNNNDNDEDDAKLKWP